MYLGSNLGFGYPAGCKLDFGNLADSFDLGHNHNFEIVDLNLYDERLLDKPDLGIAVIRTVIASVTGIPGVSVGLIALIS